MPENGHYAIFAGGTRYSAILKLNEEAEEETEKLLEIPCWVYNDLLDFDIVELATKDNDLNHLARPVSITRIWCEYHNLITGQPNPNPKKAAKGKFWSQGDIAEAKDVSQGKVSERLKFYRCLPKEYWSKVGTEEEVRKAFNEGKPLKKFLTEEHLKHIYANYLAQDNFEDWLTEEMVWQELLESTIRQVEKSGKKPAKAIKQEGDNIREAIELAKKTYNDLPDNLRGQFIQALAKRKARSAIVVEEYKTNLLHNLPVASEEIDTTEKVSSEVVASFESDDSSPNSDGVLDNEPKKAIKQLTLRQTQDINMPNSIHHGDCLELLAHMDPNSIDFAFLDLPYNITVAEWDKEIIDVNELWKHLNRICKPHAAMVFTATQPFTSKLVTSNPEVFKYSWIWEKSNGTNGLNKDIQPMRCTEDIVVFYREQCTYNPIKTTGHPLKEARRKQSAKTLWNDDTKATDYSSSERFPRNNLFIPKDAWSEHPTAKPLLLLEYLIKTYTNEGDLILDPTCGGGVTGLAAKNLNRNYILIKKDKQYYLESRKLLATTPPREVPNSSFEGVSLFGMCQKLLVLNKELNQAKVQLEQVVAQDVNKQALLDLTQSFELKGEAEDVTCIVNNLELQLEIERMKLKIKSLESELSNEQDYNWQLWEEIDKLKGIEPKRLTEKELEALEEEEYQEAKVAKSTVSQHLKLKHIFMIGRVPDEVIEEEVRLYGEIAELSNQLSLQLEFADMPVLKHFYSLAANFLDTLQRVKAGTTLKNSPFTDDLLVKNLELHGEIAKLRQQAKKASDEHWELWSDYENAQDKIKQLEQSNDKTITVLPDTNKALEADNSKLQGEVQKLREEDGLNA